MFLLIKTENETGINPISRLVYWKWKSIGWSLTGVVFFFSFSFSWVGCRHIYRSNTAGCSKTVPLHKFDKRSAEL